MTPLITIPCTTSQGSLRICDKTSQEIARKLNLKQVGSKIATHKGCLQSTLFREMESTGSGKILSLQSGLSQ